MKNFILLILISVTALIFTSCSSDKDNPITPEEEASTIGELSVTPNGVFVNTSAQVTVHLKVPASVKLIDSTVKVFTVDDQGNVVEQLGLLYDNGSLYYADEIGGDNIFSNLVYVNPTTAGTLKIKAAAQIEGQTRANNSNTASIKVFTELTSEEISGILLTQDASEDKLIEYLNGSSDNLEDAMNQLNQWLQSQPAVASTVVESASSIEIKFQSGLYGGILVSVEGADGGAETRGGIISKDGRNKTRTVPLSRQTIGTWDSPYSVYDLGDCSDSTLIGNRNVLIYAPFEDAFAPANEGSDVVDILNNSGYEFSITYLQNSAADISSLNNLTGYGYVVLATHGSGGKAFGTGEVVDTNSYEYQGTYKAMLKAEKLAVWKNMVIKKNGAIKTKADVYAVRYPFISDLSGKFPNSVILNNSCQSTQSNFLYDAFKSKGAGTYYGYNKTVGSGFCVTKAKEVTTKLAKELKTTGESFIAGNDPASHHAAFELFGSQEVHYPESLINGDFECGTLFGWTKSGDGRVISRLSNINPYEGNYLGIISTGLGYTTTTGSIFQTFKVPDDKSTLNFKWYFLSAEFLEFIGSSFQDYFTVKIKIEDGAEIQLLYRNIDGLASEFGASKEPEEQGNLINESDIVFDRGGIYGTGWQTATFDISAYRGKKITVYLSSGDVGDSIYDTAILIDEMYLQ